MKKPFYNMKLMWILLVIICVAIGLYVINSISHSFRDPHQKHVNELFQEVNSQKKTHGYLLHSYSQELDKTSDDCESKSLRAYIERHKKILKYYQDLDDGKVPNYDATKEALGYPFGSILSRDELVNTYLWKELKWLEYYSVIENYPSEQIDEWCFEMGNQLDCHIYWGITDKTIKGFCFVNSEVANLQYVHWNTTEFKMIITNNNTDEQAIIENQNQYGYGKIELRDKGDSYSISIESDDYWHILIDQ